MEARGVEKDVCLHLGIEYTSWFSEERHVWRLL
jgi:hypothetical protein